MKYQKNLATLLAATFLFLSISPARADWNLESQNSPSGLSAFASTYWVDRIGPATYEGFANYNIPFDTYFASFMVQCTKKKFLVSMSLMQTGSNHGSMALDDPGFIKLQFLNSKLNKKVTYRTFGMGLEGSLAVSVNAQDLVSNLLKSRNLKMQFVKRDRKTLSATFDVRDLSLAKTRFAYAGCKI
jgi:hypothetical protein